jgi:hypothetical protein
MCVCSRDETIQARADALGLERPDMTLAALGAFAANVIEVVFIAR